MAHVVLGLPGENRKTLVNTYNFLLEIDPDGINWNFMTPYPGTKLFEIAKAKNLILSYDWERYSTREVVMRTKELSGEEIMKISKKLIRNFRLRQICRAFRKALSTKRGFEYFVRRTIWQISRRAGLS